MSSNKKHFRLPDQEVAAFWERVQIRIGREAKVDHRGMNTIPKMWRWRVGLSGHKIALECLGQSLTFDAIDAMSDQIAAYLLSRPYLQRGDRVGIMLPNVGQYLLIVLGIQKAGMVVVNCNPLYTRKEIQDQLVNAEAKILFTIPNVAKSPAEAEIPCLQEVVLTEIGDLLPKLKRTLLNFVVRHVKKMIPPFQFAKHLTVTPFRSLLQPVSVETRERIRKIEQDIKAEDLAFIQYTGGTTGISKGAMITHSAMVYNMLQSKAGFRKDVVSKAEEMLQVPGPANAMCLHPLPFYHIYGLICCLLTATACGAGTITLPNPRDLKALIKLIGRKDLMMLTSINTMLKVLLNDPGLEKLKLPPEFVVVAGGMATTPDVSKNWVLKTGTKIQEGYGLTEASPMLTMVDPVNPQSGVAGYALPETLIKLRDEDGNDLTLGAGSEVRGEILAKGPQLMLGYFKNAKETAHLISDDGFLQTGDVGTISPDGLLEIVDRKKDMILVSGFCVYPSEVEARAQESGLVLECAAIGRPDKRSGERVVLFVVPKDATVKKEELIKFLNDSLTNYKRPMEIHFVEVLPKSAVGKILRRKVRDLADEQENQNASHTNQKSEESASAPSGATAKSV